MAISLQLPPRLAKYAAGKRTIELPAGAFYDLVEALCQEHPDLRTRLINDQERLYPYLAVIHKQQQLTTEELNGLEILNGDQVEIVTLASGG